MFKAMLQFDTLEAREVPAGMNWGFNELSFALQTQPSLGDYLTWYETTQRVPGSGSIAPAPTAPFVGLKVDLGPAPIGSLVGWPPIKVGR